MKFALDTYRDVMSGDHRRRVHAVMTFGLWFIAGSFVVSTAMDYFSQYESVAVAAIGGTLVSGVVAAVKLS